MCRYRSILFGSLFFLDYNRTIKTRFPTASTNKHMYVHKLNYNRTKKHECHTVTMTKYTYVKAPKKQLLHFFIMTYKFRKRNGS